MSFGAVLFLIFLVLKLCGVIAWSWLWVTSPLWIGLVWSIIFWTVVGFLGFNKFKRETTEYDRMQERIEMRFARR